MTLHTGLCRTDEGLPAGDRQGSQRRARTAQRRRSSCAGCPLTLQSTCGRPGAGAVLAQDRGAEAYQGDQEGGQQRQPVLYQNPGQEPGQVRARSPLRRVPGGCPRDKRTVRRRVRGQQTKIHAGIAQMRGVKSGMTTAAATATVGQSMASASKAMEAMGKVSDPAKIAQTMRAFGLESEKMEMGSEMMGDAIDDAMVRAQLAAGVNLLRAWQLQVPRSGTALQS